MSDELADSLAKLGEAGELDSSGDFTLASERAQAMMDRYLLEEPRSYVLNLVAAGVASNSSEVRVQSTADDYWVTFDGFTPTAGELRDLLAYAINDSAPTHLSELALGVMGARALKPRWVKVTVVESERTLLLTLGKSIELEVLHEGGDPRVTIQLKEAFSLKILWRSLIRPEDELLRSRCKYTPIPLYLNDVRIDLLKLPTRALTCLRTDKNKNGLISHWGVQSNLPSNWLQDDRLQGLAYVRRLKYPTPLHIVLDGVTFECDEDLGWEGVGVVLYQSGLSKDLSQKQLVRDEHYEFMLTQARGVADSAVLNLLKSWPQLRGEGVKARGDLVKAVLARARETEDLEWATSALSHLVWVTDKLHGQKSKSSFNCRMARVEILIKAGRSEEALMLALEESKTQETARQWAFQSEFLSLAEGLIMENPTVDVDEQINILEKLSNCYWKLGNDRQADHVRYRLEQLCKENGREFKAKEPSPKQQTPAQEPHGRPKNLRLCQACGSSNLMQGSLLPGTQGNEIHMKIGEQERAWHQHSNVTAEVDAWACGSCGHISFALRDPQATWDEHVGLDR